ncbi:MAG: polysaccharide deacetylase family protein [Saprospiraceae bacterium]|nr:polysaccharide deacetylase family protein [Saprospiraceae bacterium]
MIKIFKLACLVSVSVLLLSAFLIENVVLVRESKKPSISFTFDDGATQDIGPYKLDIWNQFILDHLKAHHLKAILFSTGYNKTTPEGKYILSSWNDAGHKIANHTFTHPNFNDKKTTLGDFESELMLNDSIIRPYSNYYPQFRFPYLKEGNTSEKITGFRRILQEKGYKIGHVTVDASDWYIDGRLVKRIKENPKADLAGFKKFYLDHLLSRATYYEKLSGKLGYEGIHHVILLHHNLAAALFLGDLIQHFKNNGWLVTDADLAYEDPIYSNFPTNVPAGESLIWALAKQSGKFEGTLRYPAEDGEYEKPLMDKLGL